MVVQKIKIAIIDNGVDEAALGNEISGKVYVNEKKECVYDEADMSRRASKLLVARR